jgi:hypothetical protein
MQPYDGKNIEEFEAVTERINEALLTIAKDNSLKATITELASLANVHRNTITNREWPITRLSTIKADRLSAALKQKEVQSFKKVSLDDKLTKANLEILYWFNKSIEYEELYNERSKSYSLMSKSRDSYKMQYEAQKKENDNLQELLNMVGKE